MNEMFKDYPDVVSVEQVTEMLHISPSFAYRLLRSGDLQAKKVGSKYIIALLLLSARRVKHDRKTCD